MSIVTDSPAIVNTQKLAPSLRVLLFDTAFVLNGDQADCNGNNPYGYEY